MAKFNPFRPGSVVSPGIFCGRVDEIKKIEKGLFQTKNGNPFHFVIEGERGIGKSSLFLLLESISTTAMIYDSGDLNFPVVSIELREAMNNDDIINAIILELKRQISKQQKIIDLCKRAWGFLSKFEVMGVAYHEHNQDTDKRSTRLDELTETLADILEDVGNVIDGVFILIDEADKPPASAHLGELCKLLTERLTRRKCERVSLGLAGLPGIVNRLKQSHESSARVFSVFPLEPLILMERKQVIDRGLEDAKEKNGFLTAITDDAKELIANLSEGYPHFIQEFSYCAFDKDIDNRIDENDVLSGAFAEHGALESV